MFDQMKPGHILRFSTCPSTIISPHGIKSEGFADNTLATAWPMNSHLGGVRCLSHPSGAIGPIAAEVALRIRTTPSKSRAVSYSAPGRLLTKSNRIIGSENCDFVGYVDGQSNYIQSALTVFSKDFSGCLMVAYTIGGQRHIAHAAASLVPKMDCKQAFLDTLHNMNATLIGWFRPFVENLDANRVMNTFGIIGKYIGNNPIHLTTFGIVTQNGAAYSIDAFKPKGIVGNDWVVTDVTSRTMSQSWTFQ